MRSTGSATAFVTTTTLAGSRPGTAPATNVSLVDQVPQGFKFVAASSEGRHDFVSRTVYWQLGDIPPGQTKEVSLELVAGGYVIRTAVPVPRPAIGCEARVLLAVYPVSERLAEHYHRLAYARRHYYRSARFGVPTQNHLVWNSFADRTSFK